MKNINRLFIALFVLLTISSCEDVIEIDLNSANPVIVAEAVVESEKSAWLQLSYSSDYFDPDESEKIENAIVSLRNNDQFIEHLSHTADGRYVGLELATLGTSYTIDFDIDGTIYSATTYINEPQEITNIEFEESPMQRPNESNSYFARVTFTDNPDMHNFYMFKIWINDELYTDNYYLVDDDFFTKTGSIETILMRLFFDESDEVRIQLYSIDENAYIYYNQLNDNLGGMGSSSTPFNPTSNFGENVMGLFAGWSYTEFTTKVEID